MLTPQNAADRASDLVERALFHDDVIAARAERDRSALFQPEPADARAPLLADARLRFDAPDAVAARAALTRRVQSLARSGGLLIEALGPVRAPAGLAAVRLQLSGPEKSMLALIDTLEADSPLVRFAEWRIDALEEGEGVRFSAVAVAVWQ